jgi:hypothetical protein
MQSYSLTRAYVRRIGSRQTKSRLAELGHVIVEPLAIFTFCVLYKNGRPV